MLLNRLCFCILIFLVASLAMPMPHALAQRGNPQDADQPGMIPDAADEELSPELQRQMVSYRTNEAPGTIIVHTSERFLYVIQPSGRAIRYGIGVGRDGFQWQGLLRITRKQEWPDWTPPPEMIERQPYLPRFMAGGPGQSAGRARALSRQHRLSHPRDQCAADHRDGRVVRMFPPGQSRCHRSVRSYSGRHQSDRPAAARIVIALSDSMLRFGARACRNCLR